MKNLFFSVQLMSGCLATSISFAQPPNLPGAGNALSFNGTSDYVDIPNNPITQDITFSCWVKRGGGGMLLGEDGSYEIAISGGKIYFYTKAGTSCGAAWTTSLTSNSSINSDWHHIAVTREKSTGKQALYIDGILDVSGTFSTGTVPSCTYGRFIGCRCTWDGTCGGYFSGQLDEVRIYNRALPETEIRNTMCQKLVGNKPGLVGYWRFDETSGNKAYDSSGNGNHGTLK